MARGNYLATVQAEINPIPPADPLSGEGCTAERDRYLGAVGATNYAVGMLSQAIQAEQTAFDLLDRCITGGGATGTEPEPTEPTEPFTGPMGGMATW